jgi:photosystem II stability/assembly factor-like uncharacterized protein
MVDELWIGNQNKVFLAGTAITGVYRSTDGASSWEEVYHKASQYALATGFAENGSIIYAGTTNGLLQSTDEGVTWSPALALSDAVESVASGGGALYVGIRNGCCSGNGAILALLPGSHT